MADSFLAAHLNEELKRHQEEYQTIKSNLDLLLLRVENASLQHILPDDLVKSKASQIREAQECDVQVH